MITVALAGNPNCGKTTLFNALTGSTAHVGNWPGVTVDKRAGVYKKGKERVEIIDLPGIYSTSPYTPEEVIARNYILDEKPRCVINVIDATNLERNLYLTTQLMEIDVPIVIALNMIDAVEKAGDNIDVQRLEKSLGLPVISVSALKNIGITDLMSKVIEVSESNRQGKTVLQDGALKHLIGDVKIALASQGVNSPLFHAIKLVEKDEIEVANHRETVEMVDAFKGTFNDEVFGDDFESIIANERYKYITERFATAITRKEPKKFKDTRSDKADRVLTHKVWGIPIFLLVLFGIFHLTFSEDFLFLNSIFGLPTLEELGLIVNGRPINYGVKILSCFYDGALFSPGVMLSNLFNDVIVGELFGLISGAIDGSGISSWAVGLINNGILDGISGVLSFLPWILVLFLFFSILEDSGYMARIAFILDRIFRKFGLSGRAFMPMIMGFGCSVPAMINTRTLADEKEKIATVRVIPFFSCGAKLPILTAVAGGIVAYFGVGNGDLITYGMYLLGIVVAVFSVLLMRSTTLRGETPPFIMELPTYHFPQFKNLILHLWDKAKHFLKKAFTIIFLSNVIIWVLSHFSFSWQFLEDTQINQSILAGFSQMLQPIFTPLGFGSQLGEYGWVFGVAIVTGLIAKENVIATFSVLASCLIAIAGLDFGGVDIMAEEGVGVVQAMIMATGITIPALISFIAFNMTTIPCFAAVATARSELGNRRKFNWTLLFWILTSYVVSSAVYTIGSWWWTVFVWLALFGIICLVIVIINKKLKGKEIN